MFFPAVLWLAIISMPFKANLFCPIEAFPAVRYMSKSLQNFWGVIDWVYLI
jgi:hypothetical protein